MMSAIARVIFGSLLLAIGLVGCAEYAAPPVSVAKECERSGGVWRTASGSCELDAPRR